MLPLLFVVLSILINCLILALFTSLRLDGSTSLTWKPSEISKSTSSHNIQYRITFYLKKSFENIEEKIYQQICIKALSRVLFVRKNKSCRFSLCAFFYRVKLFKGIFSVANLILYCFGPYWLPLACVCISINAEASSGIAESNGRRKYGLSKERNMVGMCSQIFYLFARNICANKKKQFHFTIV